MYRLREEIIRFKYSKGGFCSARLFLGGDVEAIVTCQVTPEGKLASIVRNKVGTTKTGGKRLVQEEGGNPITLELKNSKGDQQSKSVKTCEKDTPFQGDQEANSLCCSCRDIVCMNNHYYTINGKLRCQLSGGAIGSELTGEVS